MKRTNHITLWTVRVLCVCSWAMVTALMLSSNPEALVGLRGVSLSAYSTAAHVGSFILLSTLTLASRPPLSTPATLALLILYGAVVESLQGFVPHRFVSLDDFAANALGIAVGAAVYAAAEWLRRWRVKND